MPLGNRWLHAQLLCKAKNVLLTGQAWRGVLEPLRIFLDRVERVSISFPWSMTSTCVTAQCWKTAPVQCVPCHRSKGELHQVSMQVRFCLRQRDALQKMPSRWKMDRNGANHYQYRISVSKTRQQFQIFLISVPKKHWRTCNQVTQACATATHARRCIPPRFAQERPRRSGRPRCSCLRCHFPCQCLPNTLYTFHFPTDFPKISAVFSLLFARDFLLHDFNGPWYSLI